MSTEAALLLERLRDALAPAYRLERLLGAGGMAVVYLAHDEKHDRRVALKILRHELAATIGSTRFSREIRVAARLAHPNILPVLDSGLADGTPFYVMPFVDGESLRERLDRDGVLTVAEAVALTTEVADALSYAHAAGIVHRDIKPENILLLGGHAVVADFGIARAITEAVDAESATSPGLVMGTPAYMSPEQAAGDAQLDARSDVYALATVLFEMLTGALPFTGTTAQAIIAQRFLKVPARLATLRADIPPHIDAAVAAALALDVAERPATAGTFARALVAGDRPSSVVITSLPGMVVTPRGGTAPASAGTPSVAVLAFTNLSADPGSDFFSDGITEEIMGALSRLRTLRVAARTSSFAFKGRRDDIRAIAEQLGVATVLEGSVRRAGSRVRVAAQLVDAQTGLQLWADQFDRELDDTFAIQDDIARAIANALRTVLFPAGSATLKGHVTGAVHELYLRGRFALNKRTEKDLHKAERYFSDAISVDPELALAFAGLADARLMLGVYGVRRPIDVMPMARHAAQRALQIDPSLAEAHSTLGAVSALFDWDWSAADDEFLRAQTLSPALSSAPQWSAVNSLLPRGRFDEARATIERARTLDPLSMVIAASVAVVQHLSGDAAGAVTGLQHALELDAGFVMCHYFLGGALRDAGDLAGSAAAFRTAINLSGGTPEMTAGLAETLAMQGDAGAARGLLGELTMLAHERYVSACLVARVHAALGEIDEGLAALDRAFSERDSELVFIGVRQSYAPFRAHARFRELRQQVGV